MTLHLAKLSGLTPKERVLALAKLFEQLTGRKPTTKELEEELRAAKGSAAGSRRLMKFGRGTKEGEAGRLRAGDTRS